MTLTYAWQCLACDDHGNGNADLAARKHEKATSHPTITHLDTPAWSAP